MPEVAEHMFRIPSEETPVKVAANNYLFLLVPKYAVNNDLVDHIRNGSAFALLDENIALIKPGYVK